MRQVQSSCRAPRHRTLIKWLNSAHQQLANGLLATASLQHNAALAYGMASTQGRTHNGQGHLQLCLCMLLLAPTLGSSVS